MENEILQNTAPDQSQPAPQAQTPAPAAPEKPSGRISARSDVLSAFNEIEARDAGKEPSGEAPSAPEAKPEAPEKPAVVKDPTTGKFTKPENVTQAPAKATGETKEQPQGIQPPPGWSGGGKVEWKRLPEPVRQAISADYRARAEIDAKLGPLHQVLSPRESALVAQYGGVPQALTQLFALSDYASRDPMGFVNWFTQQRGINLNQLVGQTPNAGTQGVPQGQAPAIDPALAPVLNELSGIKQYLSSRQAQEAQMEQRAQAEVQQRTSADVQAFIANGEKYPYANDVRNEMALLFETKQASTLDEAYGKAIMLNEGVRERVLNDRVNAAIEERARAAEQKRSAAVSISGSPGGQAAMPANRKATARDDVLAAARETGFFGQSRI